MEVLLHSTSDLQALKMLLVYVQSLSVFVQMLPVDKAVQSFL